MEQMTVRKLCLELAKLMAKDPKAADKKIVVADDSEGNGYHGVFFSCTTNPKDVKENIECSNGLTDSIETDYNNIVIVG